MLVVFILLANFNDEGDLKEDEDHVHFRTSKKCAGSVKPAKVTVSISAIPVA